MTRSALFFVGALDGLALQEAERVGDVDLWGLGHVEQGHMIKQSAEEFLEQHRLRDMIDRVEADAIWVAELVRKLLCPNRVLIALANEMDQAPSDGADAGAVDNVEAVRKAFAFRIDDDVDAALLPAGDGLTPVPRNRCEAQAIEERTECSRFVGVGGKFDKGHA